MCRCLVFKRKLKSRNIGLYLAIISMYILSTIHVATRWFLVKTGFIDHGDSPATTITYLLVNPLWLATLPGIALTTNTIIADCTLIWRCWLVWNCDFKIIVLPVLCTISGAGEFFVAIKYHPDSGHCASSRLNRASFIDYATPYFSLSLATTLLATLFIVLRIVILMRNTGKRSAGYGQLVEMTVESAVLYSVTLVVFLPFLVQASFNDGYPEAILAQMTGIAPTLIIARVSFGYSRPVESWKGQTSTIVFEARQGPQPTNRSFTGSETKFEAETP
ncbi:hypothetical protein B0H13DRAFT_1620047 [Mycena leptocephala]|nr:hypothetical protein B0H13DRAFT_1620047 [Mycena leptocephala]